MKPYITPALPGEGEWVSLDADPFLLVNPGSPAAFVTSFIRTDRERQYTRIYVTIWDPRQIEMHMMAGTVEPIGASGEAGPGLIPRTPEIIGRLVAGMNGGFQALHGEFGMMGDGIVYLPPKPYAATVAAMRDGSTGFGEWPADEGVPDGILSYRQNLTVLVKDEKFNPLWPNVVGRHPSRTDRQGAQRAHRDLPDPRELHRLLLRHRDRRRSAGPGDDPRTLQVRHPPRHERGPHRSRVLSGRARPRAPTGRVTSAIRLGSRRSRAWSTGWNFRGRTDDPRDAADGFPRYIHREARDFFYLTLRHVLPGANVTAAAPDEGKWQTRGLPQHGFPFAVATTSLHPDPAHPDVRVELLADRSPCGRSPGGQRCQRRRAGGGGLLEHCSHQNRSPDLVAREWCVFHRDRSTRGRLGAVLRFDTGRGPSLPTANAAIGIADDDGMLIYAETSPSLPDAPQVLDRLLARLGCSSRMMLAHALTPALGGTTSLSGNPVSTTDVATVRLVRREAPSCHSIFEETPVVAPEVWQPLQMRRVR